MVKLSLSFLWGLQMGKQHLLEGIKSMSLKHKTLCPFLIPSSTPILVLGTFCQVCNCWGSRWRVVLLVQGAAN